MKITSFLSIVGSIAGCLSVSALPSPKVFPGELTCDLNRLQTNYVYGRFGQDDFAPVGGQDFTIELQLPKDDVSRFTTSSCYLDTKLDEFLPETYVIPLQEIPVSRSTTMTTFVGLSKFRQGQYLGKFSISCLVNAPDSAQTYKASISFKTTENEYVFVKDTCKIMDVQPLAISQTVMMPLFPSRDLNISLRGLSSDIITGDFITFSPCQMNHHLYEAIGDLDTDHYCSVNGVEKKASIRPIYRKYSSFTLRFHDTFTQRSTINIHCDSIFAARHITVVPDMRSTCVNFHYNRKKLTRGIAHFHF